MAEEVDVHPLAGFAPGLDLHPQAAAVAQLAVELALVDAERGGAVAAFDGGGDGGAAARVEDDRHVTRQALVGHPVRLHQPLGPGLGREGGAGDFLAVAVVGEQQVAVAQPRMSLAEAVEGGGGRLLELALKGDGGVPEEVPDQRAGEQPEGNADEHRDHRDRQHADQEVRERELAADAPEEAPEETDAAPQPGEHQRRRQRQHVEPLQPDELGPEGADEQQADEGKEQRGSLAHRRGKDPMPPPRG